MRIRVLSDLHLEMGDWTPPVVEADLVVLAGDIHVHTNGVAWAARTWPDTPVVYVPGNHEYYGDAYPHMLDRIREEAEGTSVTVLAGDELRVGGVRFLGCTLWTDFLLHGEQRRSMAMLYCTEVISDYRQIKHGPRWHPLRPRDTIALHEACVGWLDERFGGEPGGASTVVVTHHAPSVQAIRAEVRDDTISTAYASALETWVRRLGAGTWIHGHIHRAVRYELGPTRVVCNPRGYPEAVVNGFEPDLVLDVPEGDPP